MPQKLDGTRCRAEQDRSSPRYPACRREKATQKPYSQLMHDQVLSPLGMSRTGFSPADVMTDGDYAVGANCTDPTDPRCFDLGMPEVIEQSTYDNPWGRPAGYAWSSVLDMAEFAASNCTGSPMSCPTSSRANQLTAHLDATSMSLGPSLLAVERSASVGTGSRIRSAGVPGLQAAVINVPRRVARVSSREMQSRAG